MATKVTEQVTPADADELTDEEEEVLDTLDEIETLLGDPIALIERAVYLLKQPAILENIASR